MDINIKESDEHELMFYKIALMHVIKYCQNQMIRMNAKFDKIQRKKKNVE